MDFDLQTLIRLHLWVPNPINILSKYLPSLKSAKFPALLHMRYISELAFPKIVTQL